MTKVAVVGGAGHIGLPLSLVIAESGIETVVVDCDKERIRSIQNGRFPFVEEGGQELLDRASDFPLSFTSEYDVVRDCDVVILTIGTPVDEHHNPDLTPVFQTVAELESFMKSEQVLILRSTLFPGTSKQICDRLKRDGLDVSVSFCPERIAQGHALEELKQFPQIVSGSDEHALSTARELFSRFVKEVIELDLIEAELAKLFTNVWRYITFAVANQFYTIAQEHGLNFPKVRRAIMHNYDRLAGFPKSGFTAGPCLFKDTMQLDAFSRKNFQLGTAAMQVNESLPNFLVDQVKSRQSLAFEKIGILGMAFKPDNDDSRESLAYKLRRLLSYENATVMCTDPYIENPSFFDLSDVMEQCDLLFIGCPHREYVGLDMEGKTVIDCWDYRKL